MGCLVTPRGAILAFHAMLTGQDDGERLIKKQRES
jgi:hypothetical protein